MGVPGCPEFARWTASMDSVRMVLTHSSSKARWSVCTVKAAPLLPGSGARKLPKARKPWTDVPAASDRGLGAPPRPPPGALARPLTADWSRYIVDASQYNDTNKEDLH